MMFCIVVFDAIPVFAIADPDTLQINAVWVYRNCAEDDDQLYIIDHTIDYTANPTENVTEAFLIRLLDAGGGELGAVAPYAYYDDGYDRGVASIYFSAADAPAWNGAYTMQIIGNPTLSWTGDPPSTSTSTFDLWQDYSISTTQTVLSSRVLYLADQLELAWSVDMIETTGSGSVLTSYGQDYFMNVIENLSSIAPYAFSGQVISPNWDRREYTQDYAADLEATVTGTPLDITDMATHFGTTRGVLTALLYYACVGVFVAQMTKRMQSMKPALLMTIPFVIGGAFLGVPLIITILAGFICLILIGYTLFYQKSTA